MRLSSIAHLYRVRVRSPTVLAQEILAVLGLAVGVSLLFASQVSSTSLNDSVGRISHELVGSSQLQLAARGPSGMDERILAAVRGLPGVKQAAPVLERPANAVGPSGSRGVELIGIDPRFALSASPLLQRFHYAQIAHLWALAVPAPLAAALGVQPLEGVQLQLAGRAVTALVGTELSGTKIGALAQSSILVAPLAYAQRLAGTPGRITRVFVQVLPGHEVQVRGELRAIAGNRLNVEPAAFDARLFAVAAAPINQGAGLFAAISALVGFLFAFNAMLLTVPLRRALIATLRSNGATFGAVIATLLFDASVLAAAAAIVGLAVGEALSRLVFAASPGYLSFAFPIGSQRVVSWHSVAVAAGAGTLAAVIGVLAPLRGALRRGVVASSRSATPAWLTLASLALGLGCLAVTAVILLVAPQSAVLGSAILVLGLMAVLPILLDATTSVFDRVQGHFGSAATRIAVVELRSPATRVRSRAIAATGAIAVFGSVAIQGAQANLQQGVDRVARDMARAADLWIVAPGDQSLLATAPFTATAPATLARLPGVRAVGVYRAAFLNVGARRVWVLAPSPTAAHPIPPSQIARERLVVASARLRAGGWAVVSRALAAEQHLQIGQAFTLPTPQPTTVRVAALSTNLSWPPGAIILDARDYTHAFATTLPDAYNVMLAPGANASAVTAELRRALGPGSALRIETGRERELRLRSMSRQGSSRLTQIATLVLIATIVAMSLAIATMIYQRRSRLARMKVQGFQRGVLWRALLVESGVLVTAGCSIGAAFGVYGELLISHALAAVTGFPVVFGVAALLPVVVALIVSALAVSIVAVPGYRAAGVPAYA